MEFIQPFLIPKKCWGHNRDFRGKLSTKLSKASTSSWYSLHPSRNTVYWFSVLFQCFETVVESRDVLPARLASGHWSPALRIAGVTNELVERNTSARRSSYLNSELVRHPQSHCYERYGTNLFYQRERVSWQYLRRNLIGLVMPQVYKSQCKPSPYSSG